MAPDEIIDPPTRPHNTQVAGTPPRHMNAARRTWVASTHTHHPAAPGQTATVDPGNHGRHPFTAPPDRAVTAPEARCRVGWSLVVMCCAETIVAAAAIATASHAVGLVAVTGMALSGLLLVAAESISMNQRNRR